MACRSAVSLITSMKVRYPQPCGSEHSSSQTQRNSNEMTKHRFGIRLCFAVILGALVAVPGALAQEEQPSPKPGKPIHAGDVLSGELNTLRVRDIKKAGKRIATY